MKRTSQSGFTLVELLVVIGIICVLTGILLPAVSRAKAMARELRSISGLRQMMIGYTMYYQDNKGSVLWGYCPPTVNGAAITVSDPNSGQTFGSPLADRYPWRLLPYVSNIWEIIHSHDTVPTPPQGGDSASVAFSRAYTLSLDPTYGINSVYVGGDLNYGGFNGDKPDGGNYVVFNAASVHRPSELIVFADSRTANISSLAAEGLHYLTPPHAHGLNWTVVKEQAVPTNTYQIMGIPQGWYTLHVVVGFFDDHVEAMLPEQLQDMKLWANNASSSDYDYYP